MPRAEMRAVLQCSLLSLDSEVRLLGWDHEATSTVQHGSSTQQDPFTCSEIQKALQTAAPLPFGLWYEEVFIREGEEKMQFVEECVTVMLGIVQYGLCTPSSHVTHC